MLITNFQTKCSFKLRCYPTYDYTTLRSTTVESRLRVYAEALMQNKLHKIRKWHSRFYRFMMTILPECRLDVQGLYLSNVNRLTMLAVVQFFWTE